MNKFTTIIFIFFTNLIFAQSLVPVPDSYQTPTGAIVCEETTGFGIRMLHPPSLPNGNWPSNFTLSLQIFVVSNVSFPYTPNNINYPWTGGYPNCISSITGNNPIEIRSINFGTTAGFNFPGSAQWNSATNMYDFDISLHPLTPTHGIDIENIDYSVYLDCSLKSLLGGNLSIVQKWYYKGGVITTPMLFSSQPPVPVPVTSPNIVPILPIPNSQFITVSAPYNPTGQSDWYFVFQNNGTAIANIKVGQFLTDACGSYTTIGLPQFQILSTAPSVLNSITQNPGGTFANLNLNQTLLSIPLNHYLCIKQTVRVDDCINDCNKPPAALAPQVHFSWYCANADIPPNCSECQQDYDIELRYNKGVESYSIERINPTQPIAEINTECQGKTTAWQFEVENTGTSTLESIDVTFNNPQYLNSFFYIASSDVTATVQTTPTCGGCSAIVTPQTSFTPTYASCSTVPGNVIPGFTITITDLVPGGRVLIDFDIRNIPSNDAVFENSEKFYNQWRIQSSGTTGCSTLVAANYTNSIVGINNGISGYSKASNNIYGIDDINLVTSYYPTTTDITVPNQSPTNPYFAYTAQFYSMGFSGLFGNDLYDKQALGAGTEISGYIKAEIECKDGLSIANPYNVVMAMPYNGGWVQIQPVRYENFTCTGAYTQNPNPNANNPVNVGGVNVTDYEQPTGCLCEDKLFPNDQYILYFKISDFQTFGGVPDASMPDLFTQGKFIFGFTACCPYLSAPSNYEVKLSMLPNENCFNVPATGNDCSAPTGATCCWIPLVSEGGFINVHCPGCKAPGLIVDKYSIDRTSLGMEDVNNNGQLPTVNPLSISYTPVQNTPTYSKYYNLELFKAVYGDNLQDYLQAHFEPGDNNNGGYTYTPMMTNQNINLGYIQLYKRFAQTGTAAYNVEVTGFDFYIDAPSSVGTCTDYEYFAGCSPTNSTLLHLSVEKVQVNQTVWNDLFERGAGTDDDKMLFTFGETELSSIVTQPGCTITYPAGAWTVNYVEHQKYRLRVRYNVCGNKTPASNVKDDGYAENFMYLRGLPVNISYLTTNPSIITSEKMPNLRSDLCVLQSPYTPVQFNGYPCSPVVATASQTNFGDKFFFYCEPFGSMQYFLSTSCRNTTTYTRNEIPPMASNNWASTDCEAIVEVQTATSFLKSNYPNTHFPYEFKKPPIIATEIKEYLPNYINPSDWKWKSNGSGGIKAYWVSTYYNFYNAGYFQTAPQIPISNTFSTTQNFVTIGGTTPGPVLNCINESLNANQGFICDEASFQHIRLFMEPVNCTTFDLTPAAIDKFHSEVTFGNNQSACPPTLACSMPQPVAVVNNEVLPDPTLYPPNPNLKFNIAPGVYSSNTGTVTWHFTITNFAEIPNAPSPTVAKNVYIAFNSASVPAFLGAPLQVNYGDFIAGTLPTSYPLTTGIATGNYFWLTPNGSTLNQLAAGHFFEGDITATITDCQLLPDDVEFAWGWTCSTSTVPPNPSLCQLGTATVSLNSIPGNLSTYISNVPPNYTACDPTVHQATACFKNLSPVELSFPQTVTIPQSGYNVQFSGGTSVTDLSGGTTAYSISGGSGTWTVSSNNPTNHPLVMGDGFCISYSFATNGCNVGPLQLPPVEVTGTDVCGNAFTTPYSLPFVLPSGTSNCTDCYSITKTASSATAAPGDAVMFTITVCGNNGAGAIPVVLTDMLPQYFTPSPAVTLPQTYILQITCTTVYVTGSFSDVGDCNDVANINTATITYGNATQSATACINIECPDGGPTAIHVDTDNDSQTLFGGSVSGATIVVHDGVVLTINNNFVIDNCTFLMGSGSRILVDPNMILTVQNNSIFSSCPQMWAGIRVGVNGTIVVDRSTIRDAERAIWLEERTVFELRESNFWDCVVGLETVQYGYMTPTSGNAIGNQFGKVSYFLKSEYPGQPQHGSVGRAGMLLYDIATTIGSNGAPENEFFNVNYGIEMHDCDLVVENNRFQDIVADAAYNTWVLNPSLPPNGCAIHARAMKETETPASLTVLPLTSGNTTIDNAPVGVYNNFVNTRVNSVSMTNVMRGVNTEDNELRSTSVTACDIRANWRGIDWRNNDRATFMTANGNNIVVNPSSPFLRSPACILMTELTVGNDANYNISDNYHLEIQSFGFGIGAVNVENAWVGYNQILTNQGTLTPTTLIGMGLNGGGRNTVNCNGVTNTLPHSFNFTRGMDVNISQNNRIECNSFGGGTTQNPTGSFIGMRFGGTCGGTQMRGNGMRNNWEGLHLNNVGMIGAQTGVQNHNGNTWTNYQGPFGAINDNWGNLQASEFRVHTQMGTVFHPFLDMGINTGWFLFDPGRTPFSCATSMTCMAALTGGGDDELERMIATDGIATAVYTDETKSMAEQYLFEKLSVDTPVIATDTVYQQFYDNKQNTAIGKLYEVKADVSNAEKYSAQDLYLLQTADDLIAQKKDSIHYLDSLNNISPVSGYSLTRQNLIAAINTLSATKTSIMQQHDLNAENKLDAATLKNTAITPAELPEVNNKQMNEVVITYKKNGRTALASTYSQILPIAQQCPYAGGPAVYIARAFVEMIDPTVEYFDDAVCLQSGIYREAGKLDENKKDKSEITIVPNPANNQIEIKVIGKITGLCRIVIVNMLGEQTIAEQMACEEKEKKIDVTVLKPGVYTVKIFNSEITKTTKLIISR